MEINSYSQCEEDIYICNLFCSRNNGKPLLNGIYIELGALDGIFYSNTKLFEDCFGWKGILIEPHPTIFSHLIKNRPNNFLFNELVSNTQELLKYKYFEYAYSAVSGVEHTLPKTHFIEFFNEKNAHLPQSSIYIKPKTLTEIIKSTNIKHIDFLSLDVEGHEYEVLLSWDFSIQIDVILIELLGNDHVKEQLCRDLLVCRGYLYHSTIKHNEIYVICVNN
jgi:FkbM family methyltransferase